MNFLQKKKILNKKKKKKNMHYVDEKDMIPWLLLPIKANSEL